MLWLVSHVQPVPLCMDCEPNDTCLTSCLSGNTPGCAFMRLLGLSHHTQCRKQLAQNMLGSGSPPLGWKQDNKTFTFGNRTSTTRPSQRMTACLAKLSVASLAKLSVASQAESMRAGRSTA